MLISIIIDNYKCEAFVGQTIESALAQTHPDVQVVVVDDGSPDGSMDVIRRYADRVEVIAKTNGGQGSAYNAGYARARGQLIIFLDGDDWLYPDAAAEMAALWRPGVSKIQFRLDMVDKQGARLGRLMPRYLHDTNARQLMCGFGTYGSPPGSGCAFHADFLRHVMPLKEEEWRIAADSVTVLLAPAYGEVVSAKRPLGAYRLHRPLNDGALIFNNSHTSFLDEYQRIEACKRLVSGGLRRIGMAHDEPLLLAPWEARTLALCLRFGGAEVAQQLRSSKASLIGLALRSLMRWPASSLPHRLVLAGWVLAVQCLPLPIARRIAQIHRRSAGAPEGSAP